MEENIDAVYVSTMKWSFLGNGALKCNLLIFTGSGSLDIRCQNSIYGRYVAILFSNLAQGTNLQHQTWLLLIEQVKILSIEGVYTYYDFFVNKYKFTKVNAHIYMAVKGS